MVDELGREIKFTIRDLQGVEVYKYAAEDHPNHIVHDKLVPITVEAELAVGDLLLVPALMGGYYLMTVKADESGALRAESDKLMAILEFGKDERHAWASVGLINMRGVEKLRITT